MPTCIPVTSYMHLGKLCHISGARTHNNVVGSDARTELLLSNQYGVIAGTLFLLVLFINFYRIKQLAIDAFPKPSVVGLPDAN